MTKLKTLDQLRAEKERAETQLAQEQHKLEHLENSKGQILRPTPNTAPLICGACYNTQPEDLLTMA